MNFQWSVRWFKELHFIQNSMTQNKSDYHNMVNAIREKCEFWDRMALCLYGFQRLESALVYIHRYVYEMFSLLQDYISLSTK